MRTAIVTDSNSGISEAEGAELGVFIVPMPVIIEGKAYLEGVDLSHEAFYQSLMSGRALSTTQPTPGSVLAVWDRVLSEGYDELVYIPMSSGLSSSCQTARMLAEDYEGRVQVADNHRVSITQHSSVLDALRLAQEGLPAAEIRERLEQSAYDSLIYIGVETLEFLKRGGRVTAAGAAIGTALNISPLLVIRGERLDAYKKVRGTRNCKKREIEAMADYAEGLRQTGRPFRVGVAGSFHQKEKDREWFDMVRKAFPSEELYYDRLTFSVSCHVGPEAFGMGISVKLA